MAVGVFDSGLGGLTVHEALVKRLPDQAFVYYGDNANAPYGVRDADDIFALTCKGVERLWDEGCDLVILACNTASAAALLPGGDLSGWIGPAQRPDLDIRRFMAELGKRLKAMKREAASVA